MSAHLKFGTIHPRTMAADLGRGTGAQAYLRELAFRDFYAAVLHEWPDSAWWNWNKSFDSMQVDEDAEAKKAFEAWKAGRTGFPIVDAGMRQLAETGWMHNRVRMIVASFLVKDLHLPWQWGARWFLEQLVDGDMANNQHGWQWAAGTRHRRRAVLPGVQPDDAGREVRSRRRIRAALDSRVGRRRLSRPDRRPQGRAGRGVTPLQRDHLSVRPPSSGRATPVRCRPEWLQK